MQIWANFYMIQLIKNILARGTSCILFAYSNYQLQTHRGVQTTHDPKSLSPPPLCFMSFLFSSANQGNSSLLWRNSLLNQTTTKSLKIPMTKYWPIAIALHISPTRGHGVDNQRMNRRAEHVHLHVNDTKKPKNKTRNNN